MDFNRITSRENSLIKLVCNLQSSAKNRAENGAFVLEGLRICDDAYNNGIRFDKLIFSDTAYEKYNDVALTFANNSSDCFVVPDSLFNKISDTTNPQGIIAVCKREEVRTADIDKNGAYVALENIADPSNLGAVSRTAEAIGVNGIIFAGSGCDPFSPKALRASMGTILRVPIWFCDNITDFAAKNGLTTFACVVDNTAESITDVSFPTGSVVIIGNEANGITDYTKQNADKNITIPMSGKAESLNASVAASIAMWEMVRKSGK